jgi:hypothetical protein
VQDQQQHEELTIMRRIVIIALGLLGVIVAAASPASAQYYGYGPGYGGYYGQGPYYRTYPRGYGYYGPRRYAGGGDFLTPRLDPRTGGTYCVDPRFTVQSGICKPYRGY